MSCIHYKFKSSLDYNSVTFDGLHLSLGDLKKAISAQKRLKPGEFDLEITNAQTGDVYKKLDELIAKNTSVIVSRVPVTRTTASSTQKSWEAFKQECAKVKQKERQLSLEKPKQTPDLACSQASEIDKIKAVIDLSTKGFEPASLPGRHPSAVPSDSYVCKRCGKKGHFFTHCPNMKAEDRIIEPRVKRTTGIPSTMLTIVDDPLHPGALLTSHGQFAVPKIDVEAYRESKKERPPFLPGEKPSEPEKKKIPRELLCHICEDLCVDAAIAPCCGTSFCDECLREVLLESDDHQCPSCHETNVSPDRIVANRSMRIAVTNFLNDTGYTKVKRRRSSSAGGDTSHTQEIETSLPVSKSFNAFMSPNSGAISSIPSIPSAKIDAIPVGRDNDFSHPTRSPTYQLRRGHPRAGYRGAYHHNTGPRHHYPHSHDNPSKTWSRSKDAFGNQSSLHGDHPRNQRPNNYEPVDNYKPVENGPWNVKPVDVASTIPTTLIPDVAAVASQAVQAMRAALFSQGHPALNVPPPTHLPFPGMPGFPQRYARPEIPPSTVIPGQPPYVPPVDPLKPFSEDEFYKQQKLMQSSTLPKKPVDVFDSFADLTKMRSPTPELRSRSTSPTGESPVRKNSRSRSKSPLSHHSLSRGLSPRLRSRSRSLSRPRSLIRSRSRSRPRSHVTSRSPSHLSRSQNRSRTRSPGPRLSKGRSTSKSPLRRSKLRSRSRSTSRISKARSRSLSPLPSLRRSTKSPLPLRSRSRSRSFKRSYRTRSRSWSRSRRSHSRSYSPYSRSPRRSPQRSPRSPLSPRRSYSPRRRSRSFTPRRKSPYRSRTRSPFRKRFSRSSSRSPRPLRRSYSPIGGRRSKSPYRRPLSPLPPRRRSPSPYYGGGGYRGRGRGRGYNRDGFRDRQRHFQSPPRHTGPGAGPNRPIADATSNYPPVPYIPGMGLPPPEEFFKYNPAGYEEFVRNFYAQIGNQTQVWNAQQGNIPPQPQVNHYPPGQPPAVNGQQPPNRLPWDPANMPPQIPHSFTPPGTSGNRSPKHGDFNHRDSGRAILNERDRNRDDSWRDRRIEERRFDDRDRRGDSRFHNKDRRVDSRDRRMDERDRRFEDRDRRFDERDRRVDDRDRRVEDRDKKVDDRDKKVDDRDKKVDDRDKKVDDRDKKVDDRDRRVDERDRKGDRDKGRDIERRRDRFDADKNKDRDHDKNRDKESRRSRDKLSSERKRSPQRRNSKETDKTKSKDKKKSDKCKEGKEKVKSKPKGEREGSKDVVTPKDTNTDGKELEDKKDVPERDTKPSKHGNSPHNDNNADFKSEGSERKTAESTQNTTNLPHPDSSDVDGSVSKEKKVVSKKKTGSLGLKKLKGKDTTSDSAVPGEKKGKKIKKKKLTFGSSDADTKQGLKKKKLKRLVDYKSESNCMSEDGDADKTALGGSPQKKAKTEDTGSQSLEQTSKEEKEVVAGMADTKPDTDFTHNEDPSSSPHPRLAETENSQKTEVTPEKVKSELIPELPELSKWERDDFDLLATLEAPKEKPKEKMMVPRSIVDKAEKFLSQKPMKNSVVATAVSTSVKSDDEAAPTRHRRSRSRSKSPLSKSGRKVYMDSRKDSKDKKSLDIQITVKGDKRKNDSSSKKAFPSSHKPSENYRRSYHYHSYEEDERSVVRSSSLEREMKDDRSPTYRDRKGSSRQEKTPRDRGMRHDHGRRDQDKHHSKTREKSPVARKTERDRYASKEDKESSGSFSKSTKDLRARIEEKTKAKSSVESRKMSVMDESEFVPDYEDLAPDTTSDNDLSPVSGSSSQDEKDSRKRKSEDADESLEDSSVSKHKKAKKKHKHKEKKDKKEKHKHKKKKHKQKKSKEKDDN